MTSAKGIMFRCAQPSPLISLTSCFLFTETKQHLLVSPNFRPSLVWYITWYRLPAGNQLPTYAA